MALRTKDEYTASIRKMAAEVYSFGDRVTDLGDHPCFRPPLEAIGLVYEMTSAGQYDDLLTADSPFTGGKVSRFVHILHDREDLARRFRISRFLVHRHGACIGARCVSTGALNSTFAATFDLDRKTGTNYHGRFVSYLKHVQENDLAVAGAMMDVKGDRSRGPGGQKEPDAYLRVVEKRPDGIVVRGAKASISGAVVANEVVVLPCTALTPEETDYAVCFAVPSDAPGLIHVAEAPGANARRFVGDEMDYGNARYGAHGSTHLIFENVFVPWERVFLCGESPFAGVLVHYFAVLQRLFSTACKIGHRDLLMGAAAVAAEYNGVAQARHIREKLTDFFFRSELSTGCALASIYQAQKSPSGVFLPDPLYINIAKLQGVSAIWDGNYITSDIAGGLVCTAPTARDFRNEKIGKLLEKYLRGKADVPAENRVRIMRLVEYLTGQSSVIPAESTHGAGSPQAQRIVIQQYLMRALESFKKDVRDMAGIRE